MPDIPTDAKVPTDAEVYDWIESTYGDRMSRHLLLEHRRALVDGDYSNFLPRDLDLVLQTVKHARACIMANHDPIAAWRAENPDAEN